MTRAVGQPSLQRFFLICLFLVAGTVLLYLPTRQFEFVGYDDPYYVQNNPHVLAGFTAEGMAWAFGKVTSGFTYWHPVTWMSHMLDGQLFHEKAGGHHLMNLMYHVLNVVLLFWLLTRLTGSLWRSAIVAALFAWHPIQVESVAWVTERKNLLSTLFFLLTLLAYLRYTSKSDVASPSGETGRESLGQFLVSHLKCPTYWLVFLFFALGLMSKPMLVTLPCLLLLLDFWPLGRLSSADSKKIIDFEKLSKLVLEKIPLLILSGISSAITVVGHHNFESLVSSSQVPFSIRLANVFYSYARYLRKAFWPSDLAAIYPFPSEWPVPRVVFCVLLVVAISGMAIWLVRRKPFATVGWFWFVGMLVPVIGIVQAGAQAMADRFAYVPLIGLFIVVVWGANELLHRLPFARVIGGAVALGVLAACVIGSHHQMRFWENSIQLFGRAVAVEPESPIAHFNYAYALGMKGDLPGAKKHYAEALRIAPSYVEAHNNLAGALVAENRIDEAIAQYREVVRLSPKHSMGNYNLSFLLQQQNKVDEALPYLETALKSEPTSGDYHLAYSKILGSKGRVDEAIKETLLAAKFSPNSAEANFAAGKAMLMQEKPMDALSFLKRAVQLDARNGEANHMLASALAMTGKVVEATPYFAEAARLSPQVPEARVSYARALAETGKPDAAASEYREALKLSPDFLPAVIRFSWLLSTHPDAKVRNGTEAVQLARHAVELTKEQNPDAYDVLAAAYAEDGRFSNAVDAEQTAIKLAQNGGSPNQLKQLQERLVLYQQKQTYRAQ